MRILKFARVDFLKCRKYLLFLLLFPVLSLVLLISSDGASALFALVYCLFAGVFVSNFPFNTESPDEKGFLQMLPARPGEPVLGHFAFGFFVVTISFVLGMAVVFVSTLVTPGIEVFTVAGRNVAGLYPAAGGVALLFVGVEEVLLTVLRSENAHLMQLVRIIPAFAYFFLVNAGLDEKTASVGSVSLTLGLAVLLVCLAGYVALSLLARFISVKKEIDYIVTPSSPQRRGGFHTNTCRYSY